MLQGGAGSRGVFLNSSSPKVAQQLSGAGYDWLLVSPCFVLFTAEGRSSRGGCLDLGADGIVVPYTNTAQDAKHAVCCCKYTTEGTRSVNFPQCSTNKKGLLGHVGNAIANVTAALQLETHDCIKNIDAIAAGKGVDTLF